MNDLRTVSLETVFHAIPFGLGIVDPTRRALRGVYRPGDRKAQVEGVMGAARIRLGRLRRGKLRRPRPVWRCPPRHPGRSQLLSIAVIAKLSLCHDQGWVHPRPNWYFRHEPDWVFEPFTRLDHSLSRVTRVPASASPVPRATVATHGGQFTVMGRPEYGCADYAAKRSDREADRAVVPF
jgi:hypothetical protein